MGQDQTADVDILIVGAGVTGIYQLYLAREAGYSVQLVEAGSGVGGTWYWNRYPGSRYDSESYTYGYFFSEELFREWEWSEHFAGQAENERYFNHVVDKFDLRRHVRFSTKVTSAVWDQESSTWQVTAEDGYTARARYLVAATGVLSAPFYPNVPGRESFRGESYHTGLWPKTPVDFKGKRVAVIGTGSSGVQIIPVIAPEVASLTVYQRTPNWATPLNNRPVTPEEQAELKAGFAAIRDTVGKSASGFLHQPSDKSTFDDPPAERQAFYERVWQLGGFGKIISNYRDMTMNPAANAEWSRFVAGKIRAVVKDPATAEKLIPTDHGYAGKRPPYVTDYYEAYNRPNVSLIDLKETPITAVTETGIETADGLREFDIIVWATGFDFGTGALNRIGIVGRGGLPLKEYWADGPLTHLGIMAHNFPNFFFPGGPHGGAGNNPRYNGDQSDFIAALIEFAREHGHPVIEAPKALEEEWTAMVNEAAVTMSPFNEKSYFFGTNIPGKARAFLLNSLGRPKLLEMMETAVKGDFAGFFPLHVPPVRKGKQQMTDTDAIVWPHHELGKELSNWGRWGDDDQIGTLNFITPEKLVSAAQLIRTGKIIDCGIPFDKNGPFPPGGWRNNPQHVFTLLPSDSFYAKDGQIAADDLIIMGLQASTQWDGLAHVGYDGFFYNGVPAAAVNNFQGASKNDIAKVAPKLISRGVLLDIAALKGVDALPDSYEITEADVLAAEERQGVRVESGDILCIRTGWYKYFAEGDRQHYVGNTAGPGQDICRWIHDREIAALALDQANGECWPTPIPGATIPFHQVAIRDIGLTLGEMFNFNDLAADCERDGVWEFFFSATGLKVTGAVGTPLTPVAIK